MLIFDFTGIYENEGFDFFEERGSRSLSCAGSALCSLKDITGTNCICDDAAYAEIKRRLREFFVKASGDCQMLRDRSSRLRYFDSGNYHYMSKILMDIMAEGSSALPCGIMEQYDLVVFDHHPDMQWTSYGDILSCGSWVLNALKDRPELCGVYVIGADHGLISKAQKEHPEYENRVHFLETAYELPVSDMKRNIYISVDKDVLSKDELETNWDQGDMSIASLADSLEFIRDSFGDGIMAVDVCGECAPDSSMLFSGTGIEASNRVNRMIADILG